ncbi:MAG: hypothetical protein AB1Z50_07080 [Desulfuromonadales bacterium]
MSLLQQLPENSLRRLTRVVVRTLHLIGMAGLFGNAVIGSYESIYLVLTVISGVVLVVMDIWSCPIWFVQLRGLAQYLKLLLLLPIHFYPDIAVPCLIAVIAISGFMSHAPSWIRYFSVRHWQVVLSKDDILG